MQTRRMRYAPLLLLCLPMALAGFDRALAASWPDWAEEAERQSDQTGLVDEDAVVLLDQWEVTLKGGERSGTHRRLVRILTEDGIQEAAFPLQRGPFDTFSKVRVRVKDPAGKVRAFDEDDGTLFSLSSPRILDDTEVLLLEPRGVPPGSSMAIEYNFRSSADIPQDRFEIQKSIPVKKATVHLDARKGWRVRAKVAAGVNPGPTDVVESGTWAFSNLPGRPAGKVRFSPRPQKITLALDYLSPKGESPFATWTTTAVWGAALFAASTGDQPLVDKAVQDLTRIPGDPIETVGRFVRQVRYFGVEIGWGGYRPRSPETTLTRSLGDCKDKTWLMVVLLRRMGIESLPALTVGPSHGYVDEGLPGPRQFNHVIVGIPWGGKAIGRGMTVVEVPGMGPMRFFDPTLPDSSSRDVEVMLERGALLVLDPRVKGLVFLPEREASGNMVDRLYRWTIDESGAIRADEQSSFSGAAGDILRGEDGELLDTEDLRRRVFSWFAGFCPRVEMSRLGNLRNNGGGHFAYDAAFRCPDAISHFGPLNLLELGAFTRLTLFPVPGEKKRLSLFQPFLMTIKETHEIEYPSSWQLEPVEGFEKRNSLGRVVLSARTEGTKVVIERLAETSSIEIPDQKGAEATELQQALRRLNNLILIFRLPPAGNR